MLNYFTCNIKSAFYCDIFYYNKSHRFYSKLTREKNRHMCWRKKSLAKRILCPLNNMCPKNKRQQKDTFK